MQKYFNNLTDRNGNVLVNVSVSVRNFPSNTLATIFSDNGVTPKANPTSTNQYGYFEFYAADGRYSLVISGPGITTITVSDILLEDPADGGAAQVSFTAAGAGAITRTAQDKLRETVSPNDFGVTPSSADFLEAVTAVGSGGVIKVPKASITLNSNVLATNVNFDIEGATFSGIGRLLGAIIDRKTAGRRAISFGAAGQVLAIGRNSDNAGANYQGLQIGGGDTDYGSDGTLLGNDGHASWLRLQPSKNESPVELLVYSTSAQGIATATNGTNQVTLVSGSPFNAAWVGKKFYLGGTVYKVGSFIDASHITVTTVGGGAVSFGSTFNETFHVCYVSGTGLCNVVGSTVTRTSGDPFLPFYTVASFVFKINGSTVTVTSNADTATYGLSAPPGDVTGATYTFELDINDQITTLRLQKLLGSSEENLSLYARYDGYWIAAQFADSGKYRPVILTSGDTGGIPYRQINTYDNGDLTLGGAYNDDAIRILARSGSVANRLETQAATAGNRPGWRARGADANPGMALDMQGTGDLLVTNGSFGRNIFGATGVVGATSYINVAAGNGTATVSALGATNSILALLSNGTGNITLSTGGGEQARFLNVASAANRLEFSGSGAGGRTTFRTRGSDANPGMNLDLQGTGDFLITGGTFARTLAQVTGNASADTFPTIDANIGFSSITASGATNADIRAVGRGTGGVELRDGGGAIKVKVNTTGIGFFATTPAAKPNITGSRGGNAALASFLTGLATLGLITDSTTA